MCNERLDPNPGLDPIFSMTTMFSRSVKDQFYPLVYINIKGADGALRCHPRQHYVICTSGHGKVTDLSYQLEG